MHARRRGVVLDTLPGGRRRHPPSPSRWLTEEKMIGLKLRELVPTRHFTSYESARKNSKSRRLARKVSTGRLLKFEHVFKAQRVIDEIRCCYFEKIVIIMPNLMLYRISHLKVAANVHYRDFDKASSFIAKALIIRIWEYYYEKNSDRARSRGTLHTQ
ncbi:hypothetical protein U9M48_033436, partial [Paspalum notatum var. saurae]